MSFVINVPGLHRLPTPPVDPVHAIAFPTPAAAVPPVQANLPRFYGAVARAIGPKADPAAYRLHRAAMAMLFGRFLDTTHGDLRVDFGASAKLPLIDFMRNSFTGLIGYGASLLYAIDAGYVWFAHYEDVCDAVLGSGHLPQHHAPHDRIMQRVSKRVYNPGGPLPYRVARSTGRRPDLFGVQQDGRLGVLECKATMQSPTTFWDDTLFHAFMEQAEPMLGATVAGAVVSEALTLCGAFEPGVSARIYGIAAELPSAPGAPPRPPGSVPTPWPLLSHYAQWLKLMGDAFWTLADGLQGPATDQDTAGGGAVARVELPASGLRLVCTDPEQAPQDEFVLALAEDVFLELQALARAPRAVVNRRIVAGDQEGVRSYRQVSLSEGETIFNALAERAGRFAAFRGAAEAEDDTGAAVFPDGSAVLPPAVATRHNLK